jgi:hypothetical protein
MLKHPVVMKDLLRLEELAQFLVCLWGLVAMDAAWWAYLLLLLGPDIGMFGYLINTKVGALSYNLFHHKAIAIFIGVAIPFFIDILGQGGDWSDNSRHQLMLAGLILFGHASMDRIFGYGLKFGDNFHHTHLGWIGKRVASDE